MIERAQDNLRRYKAKQPLVGHLLPYLTAEEAKQQGLHVHDEHGWVEVLESPSLLKNVLLGHRSVPHDQPGSM